MTAKDDGYDRTSLRANREGYVVHRDYAAHYFRWSFAVKRGGGAGLAGKAVLDIGCGVDIPLLRVGTYRGQLPARYVAVDLNKLRDVAPSQLKWATLYGETNFVDLAPQLAGQEERFDFVTCFEALEHMPKEAAWQTVWWARQLVKPDGGALFSTPVFDGHQASNHVHEWTVEELQKLFEAAGWRVEKRYGTFASYRDVKPGLTKWAAEAGVDVTPILKLYEELREFHSDDVLATFVAPAIPDYARNNMWKLVPA